jgi:hypothetical protein
LQHSRERLTCKVAGIENQAVSMNVCNDAPTNRRAMYLLHLSYPLAGVLRETSLEAAGSRTGAQADRDRSANQDATDAEISRERLVSLCTHAN